MIIIGRRGESGACLLGLFALTMLGKVGTGVSDLDELQKGRASERERPMMVEGMPTPVPLSTTKGAEGSISSVSLES